MEQNQLGIFRQALKTLKDQIEQLNDTSKEAADTVVLDHSMVGRLSRIDALQAQQMAQEVARRRQIQLQLQRIDGALRRMDAGEYGNCLICGDKISTVRPGFDLASTRCMGCMDSCPLPQKPSNNPPHSTHPTQGYSHHNLSALPQKPSKQHIRLQVVVGYTLGHSLRLQAQDWPFLMA